MEIHDPKSPKRFVCSQNGCDWAFRRKNDLKRHCYSKHPNQASTLLDCYPSWVSKPVVTVTAGATG